MSNIKNSVLCAVELCGKQFYIFTIIFLLYSGVFPLSGVTEHTTLYPDLTILAVTATPAPTVGRSRICGSPRYDAVSSLLLRGLLRSFLRRS